MSVEILVFCDNEGCLVPGKSHAFPLVDLLRIRGFLEASPWLGFTPCTGRPVAYVEALTQLLGLTKSEFPAVCEGGGALYWPGRDREGNPGRPAVEFLGTLPRAEVLAVVEAAVPAGAFRLEPGKAACLSLYPNEGWTVARLAAAVSGALSARAAVTVTASVAAVDVTAAGIDKGSGLREACARCGFPVARTVAIGDAENDLPMLEVAGLAACPANATVAVKAAARFVSTEPNARGVLQILERVAVLRGAGDFPPR